MKKTLLLAYISASLSGLAIAQEVEAKPADTALPQNVLNFIRIVEGTEEEFRASRLQISDLAKEFNKLSKEDKKKFIELKNKAQKLITEKRVAEGLYEAFAAQNIFSHDLQLNNTIATAYVELRDMEKALKILLESQEIDPYNPIVILNIAEIHFVSKNFKESLRLYIILEQIADFSPVMRNLKSLITFKKELSQLGLAKAESSSEEDKVKYLELFNKAVDSRDYRDHDLLTYFGKAAQAYHNKDGKTANEWIQKAASIFNNPTGQAMYIDALVEFGMISGAFEDRKAPVKASQ